MEKKRAMTGKKPTPAENTARRISAGKPDHVDAWNLFTQFISTNEIPRISPKTAVLSYASNKYYLLPDKINQDLPFKTQGGMLAWHSIIFIKEITQLAKQETALPTAFTVRMRKAKFALPCDLQHTLRTT